MTEVIELEIPAPPSRRDRIWRVTVTTPDLRQEYLVFEHCLADLVAAVNYDRDLQGISCVPYSYQGNRGPWHRQDLWMLTGPAGDPA